MTDNGAKALAERLLGLLEPNKREWIDCECQGTHNVNYAAISRAILATGAVVLTAEEAERLRQTVIQPLPPANPSLMGTTQKGPITASELERLRRIKAAAPNELVITQDFSSGRIHKRYRMPGGQLASFEGCNLDDAGDYRVLPEVPPLQSGQAFERCGHCFPEDQLTDDDGSTWPESVP